MDVYNISDCLSFSVTGQLQLYIPTVNFFKVSDDTIPATTIRGTDANSEILEVLLFFFPTKVLCIIFLL